MMHNPVHTWVSNYLHFQQSNLQWARLAEKITGLLSLSAWGHIHGSRSSSRNNTSVSLNYRRQKTPNGVNNLTFLWRLSYKSKHSFNPLNTGSECKTWGSIIIIFLWCYFFLFFFSLRDCSSRRSSCLHCCMARAEDVRSLWMMLERIQKLQCMWIFPHSA